MAESKIEIRLAALEADMAQIKKVLKKEETPWWKEWAGAFLNDPVFEEAMKLGRKWRKGLMPKATKRRKKPHGDS
jgi:hypothetical protein